MIAGFFIHSVQRNVFNDQLTKEPITISIGSPDSSTLTIIDLPGLVKADIEGQATDMIEKTHEIARDFMKQDNSLIICVLPANQDICTTTTIKEATQCNPDKSRIIGVLTKLDKLDDKEATTIPEIIRNRKLPIEKGYYGLVVSDHILELTDKNKRTDAETTILMNKGLYNKEDAKRFGLSNFTDALEIELVKLIDKSFPVLRKNIENLLRSTDEQLETFSKYHGNEELQKKYISETIKDIEKKMKNLLVKGKHKICDYRNVKDYLETNKILSSIKEHETFLFMWHTVFKGLYKKFNNTFKGFFILSKAKYKDEAYLEEIISKNRTENILIFISSNPFKIIVKEALDEFDKTTNECVENCYQIIAFIIENVLTMNIENKLFLLKNDIQKIGHRILTKQKKEIKIYLQYLFKSESSYFSQDDIVESYDKEAVKENTESVSHKTPISTSQSQNFTVPNVSYQALNTVKNNNAQLSSINKPPENEIHKNKNGKLLKDYLEKYLTNTIRRLGDVIPNFIRQTLFVDFCKSLTDALEAEIFYPRSSQSYFNITEQEKIELNHLRETKNSLEIYSSRMNELGY